MTDTPPQALSTPNVLNNAMTLAGGEVGARVLAFVGTSYLARRLGPSAFGILGFATAVTGYLALGLRAGVDDLGTREVAVHKSEAAGIALSVMAVRLVIAAGAMVVLGALCLVLPKPPNVRFVIFLSGLSLLSLAIDTSWAFKGLERPRIVAQTTVLAQGIFVAGVLLAVRRPDHVVVVPVLQFAGEFVAAVFLACVLLCPAHGRLHFARGLRLLRGSGFILLTRVSRTIIVGFDVLLLGFLVGEADVGLYTAAYRICFLFMSIVSALAVAYLPLFARASRAGLAAVNELLKTSSVLSLVIGAPLVAGCVITARPLLAALFGPSYEGAAPALQWLAVSIGFVFLHGMLRNAFLVLDRTRLEAQLVAVAAAVNIAGNILLIPRYGIQGAAFVTAVSEALIVVMGYIALKRLGLSPGLRPLVPPICAAFVMSVALLAIGPHAPFALQVLTGALIYGLALVIVGGIPPEVRASLSGVWRF